MHRKKIEEEALVGGKLNAMGNLKCWTEKAVVGRSACQNSEYKISKELGGRIEQGTLRWGIVGRGG